MTLLALHFENDFSRCFRFLLQDGFCLTAVPFLFPIVSPSPLSEGPLLPLLVLTHLVDSVSLQAGTVCADEFRNVHHFERLD